MNGLSMRTSYPKGLTRPEVVGLVWILLALLALVPVTWLLQGSFPVFTVLWLAVPFAVLLRSRDASRIGLAAVPARALGGVTAVNLAGLLVVAALGEPWSHTDQLLVKLATAAGTPDTTFAWVVRFDGLAAWAGLLAYSGLVTIFAEELFFRGWLLQLLLRRMRPSFAIVLQATLFTLPQLIVTLVLPPLQGALYALAYSWLGVGIIGGWAAARTKSIFPSLIAATAFNLLLTAFSIYGG